MLQHGINTFRDATSVTAVATSAVGIPFFIGAWPCYTAKGYNPKPVLVNNFTEAQEIGGYSDEWRTADGKPKWSLCQCAYAHFKLSGMSPAIFYNVFDPEKHKKAVPEQDYPVSEHSVLLSANAILNDNFIVKNSSSELTREVDYTAFYTENGLKVELLESGSAYSASSLSISYDGADFSAIKAADIEAAVEAVEMCKPELGIVPDLLCAPGWSSVPSVAAVMAAKAPSVNGLYRAKAVVDLDSTATGAPEYSAVYKYKNDNGYTSEDMIVCWPMVKNGDKVFDLSVILCGLIAKVDTDNAGCPYESPSNKAIPITGTLNGKGEEITITQPNADVLSVTDGVVTVLNDGGWVLWGNCMGCYPKDKDVAKMYICTSRVQDWICNTFVDTYKNYIDRPLTPILRDAIINSFNSWLNGLTAEGKLYGGEILYVPEYNPVGDIMGGKIRLDVSAASPVPLQRIDMHVVYSVDMLEAALNT